MAFWPKKSEDQPAAGVSGTAPGVAPHANGLASRITPIASGRPNDQTLPPDPTAPGAEPPAAQPLTAEQ